MGTVDPAELGRVLRAAEATSASRPQAALAAEGRRLFNSTTVAKAGESCGGCHIGGGGTNPDLGTIVHPQKEGDFTGPRDVPSLWGAADTAPYGWAGQEPSLGRFAVGTIESHFKGGDKQSTAKTAGQVAALVAYLDTLKPPVSAFDQGTLSASARRGEDLFQGKGGCIGCHSGPLLTDNGAARHARPEGLGRRHGHGGRDERAAARLVQHAADAGSAQHRTVYAQRIPQDPARRGRVL